MPTILACLPDSLFEAARRAIPDLVRVGSLVEARALLRSTAVDGLICDPTADGGDGAGDLFWLATDFPELHVRLYASLSKQLPDALSRLAAAGITDVVLYGYEDSAERWDDMIVQASARHCVGEALRHLGPALERVPQPLRFVLQDAFYTPRRFRTVDQLAATAGATRRAFYHRMRHAGIRVAREWIDWGRIVNACALLGEAGRPPVDVARVVGWSDEGELQWHLRAIAGYTVDQLQRGVLAESVLARMCERLLGAVPESLGGAVEVPAVEEDRRRA